jgi:stearoyl-CoA desaturase (Delta-9 desaturase)
LFERHRLRSVLREGTKEHFGALFCWVKYSMTAILYTLITTHITILCVTLFLHRGQAHKAIVFNPILEHFMRFWLWLTTGMVTKQWVAIHRKHHRYSDVQGDPHSPHVYGIHRVLFKGALLYHDASKDKDMVNTYGVGTPSDWVEHNIYTNHSRLGIGILFLFNIWLFGWIGAIVWGVQMLWIPFWAAGVINGIGHWIGYRNGSTKDHSRNISPLGIIIGGEELHNNHHLNPASAKLSKNWYEFDIGYFYLKIFEMCRLAKIKS